MRRAVLCFLFGMIGVVLPQMARGAAELSAALPHDTLAFVELDPAALPGGKPAGEQNALLDMGLEAMQSFGVLPRQAEVVGDALGLAAVAGNHRSCMALLDADLAVEGQQGLACRSVQLAWVIDNQGNADDARGLVERLTRLLDHFSSPKTARQTIRKTAEARRDYVEFRDSRWPAWMMLAWIQDGDRFVLTVGAGAMEHYLSGRPVGGAPWLETVAAIDAQAARLGSRGATLGRLYVSVKAFRDRFPEAMNRTILGKMFSGLGFGVGPGGTDGGLMTARGSGRVISLDGATVSGANVTVTPWTLPLPADSPLLKLVPAEASAYLALQVEWTTIYPRALALLNAIVTAPGEESLQERIAGFARERGLDVNRDVLSRLSPVVMVHDAPPHPLKLPLMVTAVGAADASGTAKKSLEALLAAAGESLEKAAAAKDRGDAAKDLMRFRLRTDKDGVMYMQFGLVGPAWAWTENRFVWSWSPAAVRYNLPLARALPPGAFTQPGPLKP